MEIERLRQVLADLSGTLVALQRQIDEAGYLLATVSLHSTTPGLPSTGSDRGHAGESHSHSGSPSRFAELERRAEELEMDKRELTQGMEELLTRHGRCEAEINRAASMRNEVIRKYRLLVKVAADLLQRVMQEFPEEEFDEETSRAVEADLRHAYSPDTSPSSSSGTARPRFASTHTPRSSGAPGQLHEEHEHHPAPNSSTSAIAGYASSTDSQLSALTDGPAVGPDGLLLEWKIHTGSKCPASVKVTAGPFTQQDFVRLGIENTVLEGILCSLTHSNDVDIRIASLSLPLQTRGLPDARLVFLYDPWYLESGLGTYILDWATRPKYQAIIDWLGKSSHGEEDSDPVFHTFTFSKKKGRWYYFGGLRWSLPSDSQPIWPTLVDDTEISSRATILQHLSERSHGKVQPAVIEQQIESGHLVEASINITPGDEESIMEEISSRLGKRLRATRMKVFPARGDQ